MIRNLLLSAFVCVLSAGPLFAQDIRQKLGKPSNYEMQMTNYQADTSAAAVVLSQDTRIYYEVVLSEDNPFKLIHEYEVRIKVLKPEGVEAANIAIPYYEKMRAAEVVRVMSATAYNLEGSKVVATTLDRKDIFDEMVGENTRLKKFSIPGVRTGSVIEYSYVITSNISQNIHDVEIQGDYPVIRATGSLVIPKFFRYNVNTTGYHKLKVERKPADIRIPMEYEGAISGSAEMIDFSAENIPALKNEPWVWCPSDFRSMIIPEIAGLYIPGVVNENFSVSWTDVFRQLNESEAFGRNLKMPCPYAEEVKKLAAETEDQGDLVRGILKLVTSRVKWDKTFRLYSDNIKKAVRDGSGSSASVNFILHSALREAGFAVTPILLNPRSWGRMPYSRPMFNKINTFVLMVETSDGQVMVVDATDRDNDVNVIPPELMVDRARLYGEADESQGWINLSNPSASQVMSQIACELTGDGRLTAEVTTVYTNLEAMLIKKRYRNAASEEEFVEELERRNGIEIENYHLSDLEKKDVLATYSFRQKANGAGDFIYINASVIPFLSESVFKQQQRSMPVEFPYMQQYRIECQIKIPEGYAVEELPKNERLRLPDSGVMMQYTARKDAEGHIRCELIYVVGRMIYPVDEYPTLFELFGHIAAKCNANIVLKRI